MTRHELLAWHVGALDRDAGTRVEAHLATCGECLEAFFAMKRLAADGGPTPSAALAARLRQSVAAEFAAVRRPEPRRVRAHVGMGMAAVAAGAALVLGAQWAARGDRPNDDTAGRAPAVTQARDATGEGSDGAFETDSARGFESEADASASIGVL